MEGEEGQEAESEQEDDNGVTRCICGFDEESEFMIFCERCGTWQHGDCVGVVENAVPDNYKCFACHGSMARRLKRHQRAPWSMRRVLPRNSTSALRRLYVRPSKSHKNPSKDKVRGDMAFMRVGHCRR